MYSMDSESLTLSSRALCHLLVFLLLNPFRVRGCAPNCSRGFEELQLSNGTPTRGICINQYLLGAVAGGFLGALLQMRGKCSAYNCRSKFRILHLAGGTTVRAI